MTGVTVLIAAYDAAGFISRAIESALAQEGVELEIVVVDDCSTDATAEVVTGIAARDPRVRLLSLPENGGPSRARNAGLEAARGRWVAVLDADDAFAPGRLARLVALGEAERADVVADNFLFFDAKLGRPTTPALQAEPGTEVIDLHTFVARARPYAAEADYGLLKPVFRRAFLNERGLRYPVNSRHGEDFLLMVDILAAGARYVLARPEPGYLYTLRSSGFSRTPVNYDAQVAQTAALGRRGDLVGDTVLRGLLAARMKALDRLSAERRLDHCIARRDFAGAALVVLGSVHGPLLAARKLRRRLAA